MSIRVMSQVWDRSAAKGSELLLLLAIADFAGDDGTGAYPSIGTLAKKVRMSSRQVQRLVGALTDLGELAVVPGPTSASSNSYAVVLDALGARANPKRLAGGDKMSPRQDDTPRGDKLSPRGDTGVRGGVTPASGGGDIAMSPDPSVIHPLTVIGTGDPHTDGAEVWNRMLEALRATLNPVTFSQLNDDRVRALVFEKGRLVVEAPAHVAQLIAHGQAVFARAASDVVGRTVQVAVVQPRKAAAS